MQVGDKVGHDFWCESWCFTIGSKAGVVDLMWPSLQSDKL